MKTHRPKKYSGGFLKSFWRFGSQKYTIMLVPHSEKKTVNFQISLFAMFFMALIFFGFLGGFFWFSLDFSGREAMLANQSRVLAETEASLDKMRNEIGPLMNVAGNFKSSLAETREIIGLKDAGKDPLTNGGGDLASLFSVEQSDESTLAEVGDLRSLRTTLDDSVATLNQFSLVLSNQKVLLSEIPTIWPLRDVKGWVTMVFGPSIHPMNKYWYLHRGVDIAFDYGLPILATADGKVVKKEFDQHGFGYYIDIQHKYGFKTRYAHLQQWMVDVGQQIAQGDIIGTMGNSGNSTGPHLHYEVMIGTQLVDPIKFLNMSNPENPIQNVTRNLKRYQ